MKKNRLTYIDFLKGFGIILMIMGHVGFGTSFDHYIHGFHMQLFFIAAGMFCTFDNYTFRSYANKNIKKLLLPYCSIGIIIGIIAIAFLNVDYNTYLYRFILYPTEGIPYAGALWFLLALFFAKIILFLLEYVKRIKNNGHIYRYIIIATIAIIGCVLSEYFKTQLPFALNCSFVAVGFLCVGQELKRNIDKLDLGLFASISLIIIISLLIMFNPYINMRTGNYKYIILFFINSIAFFISMLCISKKIEVSFKESKIYSIITKIGENSMTYLCFNILLINVLDLLLTKIIAVKIISKIIVTVLTIILCYIIDAILSKTKLKLFIGK